MVKIGFLLGGFQGNGGIGRVTSIIMNELCKVSNYEICAISYTGDNSPLLYQLDNSINTYTLYHYELSMKKAIILKNAVKKVKNILAQNELDILVACGALYFPLAILACKFTKTKCVCWEHTNPETTSDYKFQKFCRDFAAWQGDHFIVLTKSALSYYQQTYAIPDERITQIYNPISHEAEKSKAYSCDSRKIISVGRLTYQKNFERLIEVASKILPKYKMWTWDIFGDGELKDQLQEQIESLGIAAQIKLRGQVEDLYERYSEYAFMVMTSRYEGFPMSLIEGAVNRLPLVSLDIPTGPNEIIMDGENGFLISQYNADLDLIEKIELLINDVELRQKMSNQAYQLKFVFSLEEITTKWKALINHLKKEVDYI